MGTFSLAGTWDATPANGLTVEITGSAPQYAFRNIVNGMAVAQGQVQHTNTGSFPAAGQGINGPVRMEMQVQQSDQLLLTVFPTTGVPMVDQMLAMAAERYILVRRVDRQEAIDELKRLLKKPDTVDRSRDIDQPAPAAKRKEVKPKPAQPKHRETRPAGAPLDELNGLVGLSEVKDQLRKLDAWAWREQKLRQEGVNVPSPTLHMSFAGNPGTGKTTIAKIIGQLLHSYGLLQRGDVTEKGRADLVGKFVGHTADQTKKAIEEAIGGVLFIDEAYALSEPGKGSVADFGGEALAVLVAEMENRRHELCVIVAGYPREMEGFLDANPGMASRISRRIVFPDYSDDELCEIFERMVRGANLTRNEQILPMLREYTHRARTMLPLNRWGNARSIRNILEAGIENQAVRLRNRSAKATKDALLALDLSDFEFLKGDSITVY